MISAALASCDSEELLSIINASPTLDTISQLTDAFILLSQQNPEKTDNYASALVSAQNSWKVSRTNVGDPSAPEDETFEGLLIRYFYNALTAILHESSTPFIQPRNSYIVASVISGTAIRRGLCFSSAQIGHITRGLHFCGSDYKSHWGPERYEINAVGACMHLVAAGKEVYRGGLIGEAELNKRLRNIESCIKDPAGKRILKVSPLRDIVQYMLILSSLVRAITSEERFRRTSIYCRPLEGNLFVIAHVVMKR